MKLRSSGAGGAHVNLFGRPLIFMAKEDDKGGGGGEGGGDDKDKGKPDPAMIAAIAAALGPQINAAVTNHLKRTKTDQAKEIADAVKAALEAAGVKPRGEDDPPDEDKGKEAKGGSGGGKVDPALAAQLEKLQKQLDKQTEETKAEKAARVKAEVKAQRDEERQLIMSWLAGADNNGRPVVRPEVMDDVADNLSRRLVRNPDDPSEIFWRGDKWKDVEGADNSDNYEDVKGALSKWQESPKGKAYAPPASIGGGGFGNPRTGGGGGPRKGDEPMSDAEIGQLIYGQTARR